MNPLLRNWLDEKNLEFNHDGYSQETLNALKEFANYVAAQHSEERTATKPSSVDITVFPRKWAHDRRRWRKLDNMQ